MHLGLRSFKRYYLATLKHQLLNEKIVARVVVSQSSDTHNKALLLCRLLSQDLKQRGAAKGVLFVSVILKSLKR